MLTTGKVSKLFDVTAQTIINWIEQGRFPSDRHRKGPRKISEKDVYDYVKKENIVIETLEPKIWALVLKKINQNVQSPIILVDTNFDILSWNLGCSQEFGIIQEDCSGKRLDSIISIKLLSNNKNTEGFPKEIHSDPKPGSYEANIKINSSKLTGTITISNFYAKGNELAGHVIYFSSVNKI